VACLILDRGLSTVGFMARRHFLIPLLFLLATLLVACGGTEPQPTATVVITGPDVRPTEVEPPTPTLRPPEPTPEAAPEVTETAVVEATAVEEPTIDTAAADATGTAEAEAAVVETETPTPTAAPPSRVAVNGMSPAEFIIMSPAVRDNIRAIFAQGQAIGRNPGVFSILGDSLIATPQSLAEWDKATYVLGDYAYLQPTIDYYAGSFGRYGPSVRVGLHSWSVFDPLWADKEVCLANEDVLDCEIRLNNPSIMLVFLGSNDSAPPGGFKQNYKQIVETIIADGVVPVLATKADRFEGPDNANNTAVRQVAEELQVPLLEFDLLANTLPGRGITTDNVHLTYLEPLDYTSPGVMAAGYPVHNLAVLMILDEVRREISLQ
jgi:hypothetical protein